MSGRHLSLIHIYVHIGAQDDELVTPEPGHRVVGPHRGAQPVAQLDQQVVARAVAEGIVDVLEAVDLSLIHI